MRMPVVIVVFPVKEYSGEHPCCLKVGRGRRLWKSAGRLRTRLESAIAATDNPNAGQRSNPAINEISIGDRFIERVTSIAKQRLDRLSLFLD